MNRHVCILFGILFLMGSLFSVSGDNGPRYPHYQLQVKLDPGTRMVKVSGDWTIPFDYISEGGLKFYLHRNLKFKALTLNGEIMDPAIDPDPKSPFMPNSILMSIPADAESEKAVLRFSYSGQLSSLPEYFANVISPDWVEMGLYFPWFPYHPEISPFTYKVTIENISDLTIFGIGVQSSKNGYTRLEMNSPTNDIVICTSGDIKQHVEKSGASTLRVFHHTLDDKTLKTMSNEISQILKLYNKWFGNNPQNITLVESKRKKGGGYARIGGVFFGGFDPTKYHSKREAYARYFAHELAHLWWFKAKTDSWEDWLNESFAEYSALMIIRELYGEEAFNRRLGKKRSDISKSPAISGFNRDTADHQTVTRVLYNKGPALLAELERKTGKEKLIQLLNKTFLQNTTTTSEFLILVSNTCGENVSIWFGKQLEKKD